MTKKDYILIARAVKYTKLWVDRKDITKSNKLQQQQAISDLVISLGNELKSDNYKFDYTRFVEACNK